MEAWLAAVLRNFPLMFHHFLVVRGSNLILRVLFGPKAPLVPSERHTEQILHVCLPDFKDVDSFPVRVKPGTISGSCGVLL